MPFKNIYFTNENLLLNVFYGHVTAGDVRSHVMEMIRQKTLSEGFTKITHCLLIRSNESVTKANISSTQAIKVSN